MNRGSVKTRMKIALGQLNMAWEDKELSLQKVRKLTAQAAAGEADMIVFPEMSLTGFSMDIDRIGEDPDQPESVERMGRIAGEYHIAIGFGWAALPEAGQTKGTNRFTVLDAEGKVLGEYSKLHPFRYGGEADIYQGGDRLVTVPFMGHTIGLFVCYDLRFPEIFELVSKQADVMLVIADWPASRADHWLTLLKARAIENQSYMAGVNCTGSLNGLDYSGDSAVFDPLGNLLGTLHGQEGIVICEIGHDVQALRQKFQMKQDRRNEFYIQEYQK